MQHKIALSKFGPGVLFLKDTLQFILRWHEPMDVDNQWIQNIASMAGCPARTPFLSPWEPSVVLQRSVNSDYWDARHYEDYVKEPDLAAALLNFLRKKWSRLEKSKAGRLKKFLSQTFAVKWERGFGAPTNEGSAFILARTGFIPIFDLQDGELAAAFEKSPGGNQVSIDDVVKARKWVANNILAGEKFAAKVLDKDEVLRVKGKSRRRK